MNARHVACVALLALAACQRDTPLPIPAPAPAPAVSAPTADPRALDESAASASLSGVADDADAAPADLASTATWRLPGRFSPRTSVAWLQQHFGTGNVRIGQVPASEGNTSRGVILFADDPTRRAYLYFHDAQRLRDLAMVRIIDSPSRWTLVNGVAIGMPLSRLEALNGRPIKFNGFDWDYGGAISDWSGGRLQPHEGALRHLGVSLDHRAARQGGYPVGDDTFASDDPRYPDMGEVVFVGGISLSLGAPGGE